MWRHVQRRFFAAFLSIYAVILAYAAWVTRQPAGRYTSSQHATRVMPVFLAPGIAYAIYHVLIYLQQFIDSRMEKKIKNNENKLKKVVCELKDSSRYDKTLELLKKYDPDYMPAGVQQQIGGDGVSGVARLNQKSMAGKATAAAMATAAHSIELAGSKLMPVMGRLWSHAAENLIADDPVMLTLLKEAQTELDGLRQRVMHAEAMAVQFELENQELRHKLGLPVTRSYDSLDDRGSADDSSSDFSEQNKQTLVSTMPPGSPVNSPKPRRKKGEPSGFGSPI